MTITQSIEPICYLLSECSSVYFISTSTSKHCLLFQIIILWNTIHKIKGILYTTL